MGGKEGDGKSIQPLLFPLELYSKNHLEQPSLQQLCTKAFTCLLTECIESIYCKPRTGFKEKQKDFLALAHSTPQ